MSFTSSRSYINLEVIKSALLLFLAILYWPIKMISNINSLKVKPIAQLAALFTFYTIHFSHVEDVFSLDGDLTLSLCIFTPEDYRDVQRNFSAHFFFPSTHTHTHKHTLMHTCLAAMCFRTR